MALEASRISALSEGAEKTKAKYLLNQSESAIADLNDQIQKFSEERESLVSEIKEKEKIRAQEAAIESLAAKKDDALRPHDRVYLASIIKQCAITGDSMSYTLIKHEEGWLDAYIRRLGLYKTRKTLMRLTVRILARHFSSFRAHWKHYVEGPTLTYSNNEDKDEGVEYL